MSAVFVGKPAPLYDSTKLFKIYDVQLVAENRIAGGTTRNPKLIEGWLRSKAKINDRDALDEMILQTMRDMDMEFPDDMPIDEVIDHVVKNNQDKNTLGFRSNENGLYLESRCIMAALREAVNTRYPWPVAKWGPTKKTAKSWFVERACIYPEAIPLGRFEPDGIFQHTGHVSGPSGKRSTLTNYEFVKDAILDFELHVADHCEINKDQWENIWNQVGKGGIGAFRSQQFGKCYISRFEPRK